MTIALEAGIISRRSGDRSTNIPTFEEFFPNVETVSMYTIPRLSSLSSEDRFSFLEKTVTDIRKLQGDKSNAGTVTLRLERTSNQKKVRVSLLRHDENMTLGKIRDRRDTLDHDPDDTTGEVIADSLMAVMEKYYGGSDHKAIVRYDNGGAGIWLENFTPEDMLGRNEVGADDILTGLIIPIHDAVNNKFRLLQEENEDLGPNLELSRVTTDITFIPDAWAFVSIVTDITQKPQIESDYI